MIYVINVDDTAFYLNLEDFDLDCFEAETMNNYKSYNFGEDKEIVLKGT